MNTLKHLRIQTVIWITVLAFMPSGFAQDALNQLKSNNNSNGNQGYVQASSTPLAAPAVVPVASTAAENSVPPAEVQTIVVDKNHNSSNDDFKNYSDARSYIDNTKYTLGPDDEIEISVMRHPEVTGKYTINREGKIQYEFVGDLVLAGLTKDEAVDALSKRLSMYIIKPSISLKITGYNSKTVYVVGEVATPGRIAMRGDTITVRDALLAAGLPLITAATNRSSLFTPSATGKVYIKKVDVEALLYKGDLRQNFVMRPGDCLYVPATFLAKTMRAISPVTTPVSEVASTGGAAKYAI